MEIYQALKNDHEELKVMLNELVNLNRDDDFRMVLIEQISSALIPHSRAEESVFYNTLRAVDADTGILMHSFKEHMEAESLLRLLQVKEKADFDWKTTALKLKEGLEHHIQEEESKVFALAKNVFTKEEATGICEAFLALKKEVSDHGFFKNSLDVVINLMPPRFVDKVRNLGT